MRWWWQNTRISCAVAAAYAVCSDCQHRKCIQQRHAACQCVLQHESSLLQAKGSTINTREKTVHAYTGNRSFASIYLTFRGFGLFCRACNAINQSMATSLVLEIWEPGIYQVMSWRLYWFATTQAHVSLAASLTSFISQKYSSAAVQSRETGERRK